MSCENDWAPYHAGRGINRNLYYSIDSRDFRRHSWLDPDRSSYAYKRLPSRRRHLLQGVAGRLRQHQVPSGAGRLCRLQGGRRGRPLLHARRGDVLHRGRGHGAGRRPGRRHPPAQRVHDLLPHDERRDLRLHEQVGNARRVHQRARCSRSASSSGAKASSCST